MIKTSSLRGCATDSRITAAREVLLATSQALSPRIAWDFCIGEYRSLGV
jgi:hypothetical protein